MEAATRMEVVEQDRPGKVSVKLLLQPGDGILPLIKAITGAKRSVEIVIFRFDRGEIEKALGNAVGRGVSVRALIAHKNRSGEYNLRKLEMRLLAAGVTVARTADDLVRYHDKLMIIDRRELYLCAFNLTYLDIEHSRSFGIITKNRKFVREAVKLFEADSKRRPYEPGLATFVVSPANARKQLSSFLKGAKKELLIYDPEISDPAMIRLLEERFNAGVDIKIIGRLTRGNSRLMARELPQVRLHTRTIMRDGRQAFIGSQSLREAELDARREVGIIFRNSEAVKLLVKTFQDDWAQTEQSKEKPKEQGVIEAAPAAKLAKKVAKAVTKDLPPVAPVLDGVVKEAVGERTDVELNAQEVEDTVKEAVKAAVKEVVRDVIEDVVEHNGAAQPRTR